MSKKLNLEVRIGGERKFPGGCTTLIKGAGRKFPQFPSDLANESLVLVPSTLRRQPSSKLILPASASRRSPLLSIGPNNTRLWDQVMPLAAGVPEDPDFAALRTAANDIQGLIIARQFDDILENTFEFGRLSDGIADGKRLAARYQGPVSDHEKVVTELRTQVSTALPQLLKELVKRNPNKPLGQLLQVAVSAIAKKLMPIVGILNAYSLAFTQNANGRFAEKLDAVNAFMEACFFLYQTGDLEALGTGANVNPQMDMSSFQVGDKLLGAFGGDGLGTIPGTQGPIGLHLLLCPLDMQDWMPEAFPLLAHEGRHQVFHDVKGLEKAMSMAVKNALVTAYRSGKLKLTSQKTRIGRYSVNTIDLLVKLMAGDCLGEIDADQGGLLQMGPSFHTSMLISFPAWMVRSGRVKDAEQLLRDSTVYNMAEGEDGNMELEFEAHPQDLVRTELTSAGYDLIGRPKDAQMLRHMAKLCAGGEFPEFMTWTDGEEKSDVVIKMAYADIQAAAPIVSNAIINTPLAPQNGKSTGQLVMWTDKRQAKVDALSALLEKGKADLPTNIGSIFPTYIGAASTTAFSNAVTAGRAPAEAREEINAATYAMMKTLKERQGNK